MNDHADTTSWPSEDFSTAEIEITIDKAREIVAQRDAIKRLMTNPDFKVVIADGFLTGEPRRLAGLLADKNITGDVREQVVHAIQAVGELHVFLQTRLTMGDAAERDIAEHLELLRRSQVLEGEIH